VVERKLRERMKIPVFHDDQHGTAIIVGARPCSTPGDRRQEDRGREAGDHRHGRSRHFLREHAGQLGLKPENILAYDREGVIHTGRTDLDRKSSATRATPTSAPWPRSSTARTSSSACRRRAC
jgi:malate dehydrogenase (oxaloacetate-decarboxylating)(NADP+)